MTNFKMVSLASDRRELTKKKKTLTSRIDEIDQNVAADIQRSIDLGVTARSPEMQRMECEKQLEEAASSGSNMDALRFRLHEIESEPRFEFIDESGKEIKELRSKRGQLIAQGLDHQEVTTKIQRLENERSLREDAIEGIKARLNDLYTQKQMAGKELSEVEYQLAYILYCERVDAYNTAAEMLSKEQESLFKACNELETAGMVARSNGSKLFVHAIGGQNDDTNLNRIVRLPGPEDLDKSTLKFFWDRRSFRSGN